MGNREERANASQAHLWTYYRHRGDPKSAENRLVPASAPILAGAFYQPPAKQRVQGCQAAAPKLLVDDAIIELDLVRYHTASFSMRIDHFGHELLESPG